MLTVVTRPASAISSTRAVYPSFQVSYDKLLLSIYDTVSNGQSCIYIRYIFLLSKSRRTPALGVYAVWPRARSSLHDDVRRRDAS